MITGRATKDGRELDFAVNNVTDYRTIADALQLLGWLVVIL